MPESSASHLSEIWEGPVFSWLRKQVHSEAHARSKSRTNRLLLVEIPQRNRRDAETIHLTAQMGDATHHAARLEGEAAHSPQALWGHAEQLNPASRSFHHAIRPGKRIAQAKKCYRRVPRIDGYAARDMARHLCDNLPHMASQWASQGCP